MIVFREFKKRFKKELVLAVSDLDKKIRIKVDISDYCYGMLEPLYFIFILFYFYLFSLIEFLFSFYFIFLLFLEQ